MLRDFYIRGTIVCHEAAVGSSANISAASAVSTKAPLVYALLVIYASACTDMHKKRDGYLCNRLFLELVT